MVQSARVRWVGQIQVYAGSYSNEGDDYYGDTRRDSGVHVGVTYSFGGGAKRLDCSKLYNIEVNRAKLELDKLKSEIEMLQKMKKLETMSSDMMILN